MRFLVGRQYRVLKVKRGDVLVVDAGPLCSEAQTHEIAAHFDRLGIRAAVMGGGVKVLAVRPALRGEQVAASDARPA